MLWHGSKVGANLTEAGSCLGRSVLSQNRPVQFPILEFHSWPRWGAPELVESCCRSVPCWKCPKCCTLGPGQASPRIFVSIQNKVPWGVCLHGLQRPLAICPLTWLAADGRVVQNHNRVVALPEVAGISPGASDAENKWRVLLLGKKGRKMSHCYFKNSPFFFFPVAVSAEKWLYLVFMLELCSLWYLSSKLPNSQLPTLMENLLWKSRRLSPCHLNEKREACGTAVNTVSVWLGARSWCWPFTAGVQRTETQPGLLICLSGNPLPPIEFYFHFCCSCSSWSCASLMPNESGTPLSDVKSDSDSASPGALFLHLLTLLKRQLCFHFPFSLEMILPGIIVTSGCWGVFPGPASSSARP